MGMLVSRAVSGLVVPRSVSTNVRPQNGGVAIHWAGEKQGISGHSQCPSRWRDWQRFHMNVRGWVDIAYNWGICDHGFIFVGRGWGVRSAANGTDDANDRYLAACWMGGPGETPTALALAAFESLIADCRRRGAAQDVRPHRALVQTDCPGPLLTQMASKWANHPLGGTKPPTQLPAARPQAPAVAPKFPLAGGEYFGPGGILHSALLKPWQSKTGISADGDYGPVTKATALRLQAKMGLVQDAKIGPVTWGAAWHAK